MKTYQTHSGSVSPVRASKPEQLTVPEMAALAFVAIAVLAAVSYGRPTPVVTDVPTTTIRVRPADTLWDLAQQHRAQGMGTADTVELIRDMNAMSDSSLQTGQTLVVPMIDAEVAVASRF